MYAVVYIDFFGVTFLIVMLVSLRMSFLSDLWDPRVNQNSGRKMGGIM